MHEDTKQIHKGKPHQGVFGLLVILKADLQCIALEFLTKHGDVQLCIFPNICIFANIGD